MERIWLSHRLERLHELFADSTLLLRLDSSFILLAGRRLKPYQSTQSMHLLLKLIGERV